MKFDNSRPSYKGRRRAIAVAVSLWCGSIAYAQEPARQPATTISGGDHTALEYNLRAIDEQAITGTVLDHNQRGLQGAIVRLEGTQREAVTDRHGQFRFTGLEAGEYRLRISYLGLGVREIAIRLDAGQGSHVNMAYRHDNGIEEVMVLASRSAQARAINLQRAADNIKTVVSADYLGRFPDDNVAESMQRMVGVSIQRDQGEGRYVNVRGAPLEFSNVSLDGVVLPSPDSGTRGIDLDTIPSDIISALELTKAISPDMDADAIAGNINIITQGALDSQERILRGSLAGGRNEQGKGDIYRGTLTWGDRIAGNDNLAFLLSANYSETNRVTSNIENGWSQNDNGEYLAEETAFKDYDLMRSRTGISGRLDYQPSADSHLFLSHNFSRFRDDEARNNLIVEWDDHSDDATSVAGTARARFEKELRLREVVKTINATQLGGHLFSGDFKIDFSAAYSSAEQKYPKRDYLLYRSSYRPDVAYDFSNPKLPRFSVLDGDGNVTGTDFSSGVVSPDSYAFRRYERRFGVAEEKEQAYALNATHQGLQWGNLLSTWKTGVKVRLKEKTNDEDRYRNGEGANAPGFSDIARGTSSRPFDGRYNNGPKMSNGFVSDYRDVMEDGDYVRLEDSSLTGDFKASEDTYAAYLMNTLDWDRTTLLAGVRVEHTKTDGGAFRFDDETGEALWQKSSDSYTKFFPGIHLRHELDENTLVRAAYTTGLSRPNFEQLVPYEIIEDRSTGSGTIERGNIDLKPTYAHSFDLGIERYFEPAGLISAGAFYKKLSDPIFWAQSEITSGEFAGFDVEQPFNGNSGKLYGVEAAIQKSFHQLPGIWSGLGLIANYTYTKSEADLPFGIGKTELAGTSRHTYNVGIQFDVDRFSSQLSYNYRSKYIDGFNTSDPSLNVYWDERETLDFIASFRFSDHLTLFSEMTNLTDSKGLRFQGNRNRVYEHEQFGRTWVLGLRASF